MRELDVMLLATCVCIFAVPPLEGFVMNRVLGDYFETLLYKIFVSIDEHTTVAEVKDDALHFICFIFTFHKNSSYHRQEKELV